MAKKDNYDFGFNAGSHFRQEEKGADGMTRGEYGFRTPDGCMHIVSYEADQVGGYRVLGSSKRDCVYAVTRRPIITTRRPITTTRRPITTTRRPITTTRRPIKTTRRPITTTRRPITTTRRAITTTRRPITTTRRPITTTRRPFTTRRPPTTRRPLTTPFISFIPVTSPRPRDPLLVPEVPLVVDNTIVVDNSQGRQLSSPNQTTQRPTVTTTTAKPEKKPEPLYSFGFTTPTHGHTETGLPDGSKKGEYYWDAPDGWRRIVTYEANERGFFPKMRRVRIPTTTPVPPSTTTEEGPIDNPKLGKDLDDDIPTPRGGCPYYFYYNTRINYHWEHCYMNNTKVGEFGNLGSDGYAHKNAYYADATGFHPTLSRTPLNEDQKNVVADYTEGVFIVPKPDEERRETEKRILAWLAENRERIQNPLR
ncbi:putative Insect cuticle protein-like 1 [Homarus americanus]|uniref:Putative Insect cuticle protein-like 1 n=1 Tax=Homarus americanus TaxID=6706 RepID=A0A8J5MV08_HOMAM|nr:putative Insect cuticle protein-like 1 [Homarus americanus]